MTGLGGVGFLSDKDLNAMLLNLRAQFIDKILVRDIHVLLVILRCHINALRPVRIDTPEDGADVIDGAVLNY